MLIEQGEQVSRVTKVVDDDSEDAGHEEEDDDDDSSGLIEIWIIVSGSEMADVFVIHRHRSISDTMGDKNTSHYRSDTSIFEYQIVDYILCSFFIP